MLSILSVDVRHHLGKDVFEGCIWALFLVLLLLSSLLRLLRVRYLYLLLFVLFISLLTICSTINGCRRYLFSRGSNHFFLTGN
jgi:hypothetical protein